MRKPTVLLFQPFLRPPVLNIGAYVRQTVFRVVAPRPDRPTGSLGLPPFEQEIKRTKTTWLHRIRRLVGIPNVRIRLDPPRTGDLYLTYACLLLTPKPYCIYLETGLALYAYDAGIARNPIARLIAGFLLTRRNCRQVVFMSEASRKSFFASARYPGWVRRSVEAKSRVIYPIPIRKPAPVKPKQADGPIKLLFPGTFYIKGGVETVSAYERLRRHHGNVTLTVVTALHVLRQSDRERMRSIPGLTLRDASLTADEMDGLYRSHDLFVLPTYRDGFGMVVLEALAYGLPAIVTDQYALPEMVVDGQNGFVVPSPLKDYDPATYELFGRYYNPKALYAELFRLQRDGSLQPIEDFIVASVERFLRDPALVTAMSQASLDRYRRIFDPDLLGRAFDDVFVHAVRPRTSRG